MLRFNQAQQDFIREIVYYYKHSEKQSLILCERLKFISFSSASGKGLILDMLDKKVYLAVRKGTEFNYKKEYCSLLDFYYLMQQLVRENLLHLFRLDDKGRANNIRYLCLCEDWSKYLYPNNYESDLREKEDNPFYLRNENVLRIQDKDGNALYDLYEMDNLYRLLIVYIDDRNLYYVTKDLIELVENDFDTVADSSLKTAIESVRIAKCTLWITCFFSIISIIVSIASSCDNLKKSQKERMLIDELIKSNSVLLDSLENYKSIEQILFYDVQKKIVDSSFVNEIRNNLKSIKTLLYDKKNSNHINVSDNINSQISIENNKYE